MAVWKWFRQSSSSRDPFAGGCFRRAPYLAVTVFIAVLHFILFSLSKVAIAGGPQALPAFPGAGVDLVLLLAFGGRYWPIFLATYYLMSLGHQVPWLPSCGVAAAALFRTLLGAAFLRRVSGFKKVLGPFEDIAGIFLAGVVATAAGAAAGAASMGAAGMFGSSEWGLVFRRWWIADVLGVFTVSPALLTIARACHLVRAKWNPWLALRFFLYFTGVLLACSFVLFRPDTRYLLFSVFLLILIAAAWLGTAAARLTALIIMCAAVWATRMGTGPFAAGSLRENLQNMALFTVAVSLTGIAVGAFRMAGNLRLPAAVLLSGWACSAWVYGSLDLGRTRYDEERFEGVIASVQGRINGSYREYANLSWNTAALLAANGTVEPEPWRRYLRGLNLAEHYPGVAAVSLVEPGFAAGPSSQAAAERSRDFGTAALASDTAGPGRERLLHLFVPVYRPAAPLTAVAERRRALAAWVQVSFRAEPFFRSALADLGEIVDLRVSPSEQPGEEWFHSGNSGPPSPSARLTSMKLGGTALMLNWRPSPGFPYLSRAPFAVAAGCTALLSLLLAGLVLVLQNTRRRASWRWKLLQSASALGTWELDFGSETVHCSEQLLRLYGVAAGGERFSIEEWLHFIHPEDRDGMLAEIRHRLGTRQAIDRQYRVVWPDGSIHWLHSKALPVSEDNEPPARIVGVDFDISNIKHLQSQLAQAQKLQSVGQLAAGIAHEINTPIQYIGDNGKFLQEAFQDLIRLSEAPENAGRPAEGALDFLKREVPRAASELLEGVHQVARIVRAMKEFSHPGAIETSAADLNRAIENTIVVSRNEWKQVAEVTTDLDPELPPVPCVVGEFNQVMLNLIVNAAHAIADEVKESGRVGTIHISTRQRDEMAEIRVSDTGGGIPEAIRTQVFDPFFTTKPVGKGTGQGLAIAYAVIVQKHNGRIRFESQPGRGTTFIIQLPLARELEMA